MGYQYPLEETWSTKEMMDVVNFYTLVEKAYEVGVRRDQLLKAYKQFKEIVPSKSEEKIFFSAFEKASTYSSYQVVKKARETNENRITMK